MFTMAVILFYSFMHYHRLSNVQQRDRVIAILVTLVETFKKREKQHEEIEKTAVPLQLPHEMLMICLHCLQDMRFVFLKLIYHL